MGVGLISLVSQVSAACSLYIRIVVYCVGLISCVDSAIVFTDSFGYYLCTRFASQQVLAWS